MTNNNTELDDMIIGNPFLRNICNIDSTYNTARNPPWHTFNPNTTSGPTTPGNNTGGNTGNNTGGNTGNNTGGNTGNNTGGNTGNNTGGNTGGNGAGDLTAIAQQERISQVITRLNNDFGAEPSQELKQAVRIALENNGWDQDLAYTEVANSRFK